MKQFSLVFATHNANKVAEVNRFIPSFYVIQSLKDIHWHEPIAETGSTLEENAWIKTDAIVIQYGYNCFADDSGLEIDALDGEPGVYSARYAGFRANADNNIEKVLKKMTHQTNRKAQFRSVFALYWEGERHTFEGRVGGTLLTHKRGTGGFGYDPIFVPEGYQKTFAELSPLIKNKIGHRGKALQKMIRFFEERQSLTKI
ncbi:MAG: RdgB/HAM1 family non-canonical purine NTP pyrophosphatase [Flavobacteriaceae bacterium]